MFVCRIARIFVDCTALKNVGIGSACSASGEKRNCYSLVQRMPEERVQKEDQDEDGRIIIKHSLER
jgi:hypothetical protein